MKHICRSSDYYSVLIHDYKLFKICGKSVLTKYFLTQFDKYKYKTLEWSNKMLLRSYFSLPDWQVYQRVSEEIAWINSSKCSPNFTLGLKYTNTNTVALKSNLSSQECTLMTQPIKSPLIWGVDIIATVGSAQELALICDLGRFFCSIKPLPTLQQKLIFSWSG